jgi:hypothetical protein
MSRARISSWRGARVPYAFRSVPNSGARAKGQARPRRTMSTVLVRVGYDSTVAPAPNNQRGERDREQKRQFVCLSGRGRAACAAAVTTRHRLRVGWSGTRRGRRTGRGRVRIYPNAIPRFICAVRARSVDSLTGATQLVARRDTALPRLDSTQSIRRVAHGVQGSTGHTTVRAERPCQPIVDLFY